MNVTILAAVLRESPAATPSLRTIHESVPVRGKYHTSYETESLCLRISIPFLLGGRGGTAAGAAVGNELCRRNAYRFRVAADVVARPRNAVWLHRECDCRIYADGRS